MRNRRKQTTLAVALLIAVVVLAALLVVVLRNQGATTNESNLARMARFHSLDDGWLMAEPRATSQFIAVSAQTNGGAADSDSAAQIA